MTREKALRKLKQYGIEGSQVYLIDLLPLIEMMWADGSIQRAELTVFRRYLTSHIARLNSMLGREVLTVQAGERFLSRFLETRPDAGLLKALRSFVSALSADDRALRRALDSSLLAACLDIAATSVSPLPYAQDGKFDPDERRCFFELLDSFGRAEEPEDPLSDD